jgi:tetratricopeptide (TPR) repeat protein
MQQGSHNASPYSAATTFDHSCRIELALTPILEAEKRLRWLGAILFVLGFAAALLGPQRALAQAAPSAPPPPSAGTLSDKDQQARSLFEKGRQAYGDGQYRDAWAYFHQAYQLSGRPELLYNIGQTADRLGQDADALRAFRMYVERLPAAPNRHDVENRIHALEERVGATAQPAPQHLPDSGGASAATFVTPAPAPPAKTHSGPARKGFYLRGAVGLGLRSDGVSDNDLSASILGFGLALDLGCGYAVLPGFVVGGMLYLDFAGRATLTDSGQSYTLPANLTSIGPFADWYLNRENNGWHIQGALTLSILSLGSAPPLANRSATGIGLVIGGGYEWAIAGDWSVGVLARLTLAGLTADTTSHGFLAPSLLATVSWF